MAIKLDLTINRQPDITSCGPTSLHSVYQYYQDPLPFENLLNEINQFEEGGGTLASVLGRHALKRGYKATIISYNIHIFDPSWFGKSEQFICECLEQRLNNTQDNEKYRFALAQYIKFLKLGGHLKFTDLSENLLKNIIQQKIPILTGLSATWLYSEKRENSVTNTPDSIYGSPAGHFVVIDGFDNESNFSVCDPYHNNPFEETNHYSINGNRLINAILLGISSYDGNLLLIEKENI